MNKIGKKGKVWVLLFFHLLWLASNNNSSEKVSESLYFVKTKSKLEVISLKGCSGLLKFVISDFVKRLDKIREEISKISTLPYQQKDKKPQTNSNESLPIISFPYLEGILTSKNFQWCDNVRHEISIICESITINNLIPLHTIFLLFMFFYFYLYKLKFFYVRRNSNSDVDLRNNKKIEQNAPTVSSRHSRGFLLGQISSYFFVLSSCRNNGSIISVFYFLIIFLLPYKYEDCVL